MNSQGTTSRKYHQLLKDYTMEQILEICDLDPVEALHLLVTYGALDLSNIETEGIDDD